jgi:site-specific recombinase XerD
VREPGASGESAGLVAMRGEVAGRQSVDLLARLTAAFLLSHRGATRAAYARDLADFRAWCLRHEVSPLAARRAHLDAYVTHLEAAGAKPATVMRRLAALTGFYGYAVDENLLERNPALRVRRPRVGENVQSTGLSRTEAATLLAAAERHGPRTAVIATLLLLCGLRVSELTQAQVEDLGHERGHRVLRVRRKGGNQQTMVLPPRAAAAVERYLDGRSGGPLVATATGRPMDRHAIWRLLRRLAADALPHLAGTLHPHDLRHACATLALDAGAPLRDVQTLLGHQDPRTTNRYDRARHDLDRSPSYALSTLIASAPDSPSRTPS